MSAPLFVGGAQFSYAADTAIPAPATPAPAEAAATPATPAPAAAAPAVPTPPSPPSIAEVGGSPVAPLPKTAEADKKPGAGLTNAENKISDSVKDVLKKLDKPADDVTLDDLNSARQAIAKIEIMIDVEKHLAELDKVRQERQKESGMGSMIPASALQPPMPAYQPPAPVYAPPQQVPMISQSSAVPLPMPQAPKEPLDVTQISGESGHYTALIKMTGDESKPVHVGDKLSDGSTVVDISPMEVDLDHNGTKRTLHIKNIDTVFGGSF